MSFIGEKLSKLKQPIGLLDLAKIFFPICFCLSGCMAYPVGSHSSTIQTHFLDSDASKSSDIADRSIRDVKRLARTGNRYAQLELGRRYEAGDGVEKNITRAKDLYFKAATSPGALIPTVISTPGGQSASTTSYHRAPPQFNGLKEAAMRWARLANNSGQHSQSAVGQLNLADRRVEPDRQRQVAQAMYEPDLIIEARSELIRIYGYQPIFNNLKYKGKSWRETIITGGGARLINDEMVMHSFLYALDPPDETRIGETISADRIQAFCRAHLVRANLAMVVDRRMAGLCALHQCKLLDRPHWLAMAEGLQPPAASKAGYEIDVATAFLDASFLLRVASRCGDVSGGEDWEGIARLHFSLFETATQNCMNEECKGNIAYSLRIARAGVANVLLWAFKNDEFESDLTRSAAEIWEVPAGISSDSVVRDESVAQHCATLNLDYEWCRLKYPYGYFLDGRVLALAKEQVARSSKERAEMLREFEQRFALEWRARR